MRAGIEVIRVGAGRLRSIAVSMLLAACVVLAGCVSLPGTAMLDEGTTRHAYALAGEGSPVVVFEAGLGNVKEIWEPVFVPVSRFTRAIAYDRAGYGASRAGDDERDGATIVAELRSLLLSLELPPPYVLVGHSLGGQFVELYARTHPEEIAGVVLVEARHVDFSRRCVVEQVERCELPAYSRMLMPRGARAELRAAARTEAQIRAAGPFPSVPLRVLSGTRRPESMPNLRRVWAESQAQLTELSEQSAQDVCDTCGHFIQRDAPERVVEAIREVVEEGAR
jgi:pimeloyl-ACP methyl ester carboxylesterase